MVSIYVSYASETTFIQAKKMIKMFLGSPKDRKNACNEITKKEVKEKEELELPKKFSQAKLK